MPRGGYRLGSGRPPGAKNLLTREIEARIANGMTWLEAILDIMRFYHAWSQALHEQLNSQGVSYGTVSHCREGRRHARLLREGERLSRLASMAAAKAAPYVHRQMGWVGGGEVDD
jgi:hypothetical protein